MIHAHAIAEIDSERRGNHVLFSGPPAWLFAPDGWLVERRLWQRSVGETRCARLENTVLAELHRERELLTPIGVATLRNGTWMPPTGGQAGTAEVLTIDLDTPTTLVRVVMTGPNWTPYALFRGKVVAAALPQTQAGQTILTAPTIDRVVVHAQHASSWQVCVLTDRGTIGWSTIARLQLPLADVDPSLPDSQAEWDLASSRLITGDDLSQGDFAELADMLRGVAGDAAVRPIDRSIQPDPDSPDMVLGSLDPLRLALLDPALRRALGLAHFDADPALVEGETYQYRVSAHFPADAARPRPGFHSVPVGSPIPPDFFFGDIHVRLPQPSQLEFVATETLGDLIIGRRGIALRPRQSQWWQLPDLLDASLVLDFAIPRTTLALQVFEADLDFAAFDANGGALAVGVAATANEIRLMFSGPCSRLLIRGKGRWLGLRDPTAATATTNVAATTGPIVFAATAPPQAPLSISAVSTNTLPVSSSETRPRSELGFDVTWLPTLAFGVTVWPPDADAAPPLETARFQLEHQVVGEPFAPVYGKGSFAFGDRGDRAAEPLRAGADVSVLYPEQPAPPSGAGHEFGIRDQFLRDPEVPPPSPGSMHRYRIRAVDEIGRSSAWIASQALRLEKHAPPPIPVGFPEAGAQSGVYARVLVRDAPDLTDADVTLLEDNGASTAILLRWGWTEDQRSLDPWATEFRVYAGNGGVGPVNGTITAVTDLGAGQYDLSVNLKRPVPTDAGRGGYMPAGAEYRILGHTQGSTVQVKVATRLPEPDGSFRPPGLGPTTLPVRLTPGQARADAWDERVAVVPLTDSDGYQVVLFDLLLPTADDPRPAVWVGVSAADSEPYVPDTRPGGGLPGNESPIVAVRCQARYYGRPDLDVMPPPIADVPVVLTARSTDAGIEHDFDVLPYLSAAPLAPGEQVVVERVDDGTLLAALRAPGGGVVAIPPTSAPAGSAEVPITVPNPADRAAVVHALTTRPQSLADRYLVWLAARHPYADWLFTAVSPAVLGAPVHFALGAGAARYVLRVRRVDAAGHRSPGSATCAVVLRVPAFVPLAPPAFAGAQWTTTPSGPRLAVKAAVPDERSTHLLTWVAATDPRRAQLATIGSRRDLPGFGVRLRPVDGAALTPDVLPMPVNATPDPDTGARMITSLYDVTDGPHFLWLAAVDQDGVPSRLSGAYRLPRRES